MEYIKGKIFPHMELILKFMQYPRNKKPKYQEP